LLVKDCGLGLLSSLLDAGLHPVTVIASWFEICVFVLFFDVSPDLSILEVWIELNDFYHLLLLGSQFVEVEATSVESSEYDSSDVEALGKVLHNAGES
jgi:hypothetical protein